MQDASRSEAVELRGLPACGTACACEWRGFQVVLSQPKQIGAGETLEVADLDPLPPASMIEVRHTGALYRYYRRD